MYQMCTCGSNKCMHVVHNTSLRFGDDFQYIHVMDCEFGVTMVLITIDHDYNRPRKL